MRILSFETCQETDLVQMQNDIQGTDGEYVLDNIPGCLENLAELDGVCFLTANGNLKTVSFCWRLS